MARAQPFENENTWLEFTKSGTEDKFHRLYDDALERVQKKRLGKTHGLIIAGETVETHGTFDVRSPCDSNLLIGTFASARQAAVEQAVAAARDAFTTWRSAGYEERARIFDKAADLMADRKWDLSAIMTYENGKNRVEAVTDTDEGIDFLRFYAQELRRHRGFVYDTGEPYPGDRCTSRLVPYGVFAVVSPFNFPLAILTGMTAGATITGNTAVVKPASATPLIAHAVMEVLSDAGLPPGVVNLITGSGREAGQPLLEHPDVQGVVFTGSREVGLAAQRTFLDLGKRGPIIAELGGKNAAIVTAKGDLDKAVTGVARAAFGFGGQKCSACSRVYVHESVDETFVARLVEEARKMTVGDPADQGTYLGPVIDEDKVREYEEAAASARRAGHVVFGGARVTEGDLARGNYVQPMIVTGLPDDHEIVRTELFLPVLSVHSFEALDDAITRANASDYALTGGLYSEDRDEIATYLDRIEAGVVYVNRPRSATTGALVQGQPFGGWKFSGTTGKFAGGYWYLQQFLREQTITVVK